MTIIDEGHKRIGQRVAQWRDLAGLTQEELGIRVASELGRDRPYTQAYMSQIENGERPIAKRNMLIALARAIGVAVTDLTGQPVPARNDNDMATYAGVELARTALFFPEYPEQPRPVDVLAADAEEAMADWMRVDYRSIGARLPRLLTELGAHVDRDPTDAALTAYVRACIAGSLAYRPVGFDTLALVLAQRARQVAAQLGDPVAVAGAAYVNAQCALAAGNQTASLTIASQAADAIEQESGPDAYAWTVMNRLQAAMAAAGLGQADLSDQHLNAAKDTAARTAGERTQMEATLENVLTWGVGIKLENGDAEAAPALARQVNPANLRTPQRRARLFLDMGRGYFHTGDYDSAVQAFLRAEEIAPQEIRPRPSVREMVAHMGTRGGSSALLELAQKVGVTPGVDG